MQNNNENDISLSLEKIQYFKEKYPNRIPIIIMNKNIKLDRYKYLVPNTLTISQLYSIFRERSDIKPEESIYISFLEENNKYNIYPGTILISQIFYKYNHNGILKIKINKENTFG